MIRKFKLFLVKKGVLKHRKFDINCLLDNSYPLSEIQSIAEEQGIYFSSKSFKKYLLKLKKAIDKKKKEIEERKNRVIIVVLREDYDEY